jgi:hypothetical protein
MVLRMIALLFACLWDSSSSFKRSAIWVRRSIQRVDGRTQGYAPNLCALPPGWMDQHDAIVHELPDADDFTSESLYDAIQVDTDFNQQHSISQQSISDLCRNYRFCASHIGSMICNMNVRPPLDIDAKLGDFLNGEQIYALLVALTSFDAGTINDQYYVGDINTLASDLGVSTEELLDVCKSERIVLPFGLSTHLHKSVVELLSDTLLYDKKMSADSK